MIMSLADEKRREIESFVADWLNDADVPGASVALVDGDEVLFADGFGARDLKANEPATAETLYGFGSITKSFTALAVMQLVEEGTLSVEDTVDEYVPHFSETDGEPITVEELLTHTSGMPSDGSAVVLIGRYAHGATVAGPLGAGEDFRRYVQDASDDRVTDEDRFFYYNSGYTVLGDVIEAVDGRPYHEYVREEIFEPLGMDRTTLEREPFDEDDDAMTPYVPDEDGHRATDFPFDEGLYAPGGLVSSVQEMTHYLRAMMGDGSFDGTAVCSADSVSELQAPRTTRQQYIDGSEQGYGYGWMRQPLGDDELIGHGGSVAVSTAYLGFLNDAGLGVAVSCNTSADPHPSSLGAAVLAIAAGEDPTAVGTFALREKADAVTGRYEAYRDVLAAEVERSGGGLTLTIEYRLGKEELPLLPETLDPNDHRYYTVLGTGARIPVEFDLSGDRADLFYQRWRLRKS